jgi:AraC-like DNA-binding protein
LKAGADAYLSKPPDKDLLLTTIYNLLNQHEKVKLRFSTDVYVNVQDLTASKSDQDLLNKIIQFTETNIANPDLNGDLLCQELGLSKSLLYLKLRNITGQTVNEFIRIVRLKRSIHFLLEGKLNISEIAYETGFNSPSYFTKSFTQHFGVSPKGYSIKASNQ